VDSADSFMNWGFNPKQGSNKKPYYLIYGGANPEEGDPYAGFMQFETLQSALKSMWEVWDSFESWKMEEVMEWIHEEGQGLILSQGENIAAAFPEILLLTNKYPHYVGWKPAGITQKDILPTPTPILGLTHTSGWLGEEETGLQFLKRVKNEYETYIDKTPLIEDYARELESIPFDKLFGDNRWNQFFTILEMTYSTDWNIETMKVVYAP
jgi:hypothetical protein